MDSYTITMEFGPKSQNRIGETDTPGIEGAMAALETFYHAFNQADAHLIEALWAPVEPTRMLNPIGGIVEGKGEAVSRYRSLFSTGRLLQVTFSNILVHDLGVSALFVGQERIEVGGGVMVVPVRTSRLYHQFEGRWRQLHHHGSIDDPSALADYQGVMK